MQWKIIFLIELVFITDAFCSVQTNYSHPEASYNLINVLHVGTKTYTAGLNYMLVIDRSNDSVHKLSFDPDPGQVQTCKGFVQGDNQKTDCANGILVLALVNSTTMMTCNNNVLAPFCQYLDLQTYETQKIDFSVNRFLGTMADFKTPSLVLNGNTATPHIYIASRLPNGLSNMVRRVSLPLDTYSQGTYTGLYRPTYIDIYLSRDEPGSRKLYLFYRDLKTAFESDDFTDDGETNEYGLVAKICESDTGGRSALRFEFVTFMSARLLCPYPGGPTEGNANSYYNVLHSSYKVGNIVYGLFRLPEAWGVEASAVCAFDLDDVEATLNGSAFGGGSPIYYDDGVPNFGKVFTTSSDFFPGQCPPPGVSTNDIKVEYEAFLQSTTLLKENVQPRNKRPAYLTTTMSYDFVAAAQIGPYHIVYLLTESGILSKVRVQASDSTGEKMLYQTRLNDTEVEVTSFSVAEQDLIIMTRTHVIRRPPSDCSIYTSCGDCEADPHCSWVLDQEFLKCILEVSGNLSAVMVDSCATIPDPPKINSTSLPFTISWSSDSNTPLEDLSYLTVITKQPGNSEVLRAIVEGTEHSIEVDNQIVEAGAKYSVSVQAINQLTASNPAEEEFEIELAKPFLTVEVEDMSCQLIWNETESADVYNISLFSDDGVIDRSFITMADSSKEQQIFTVGGLSLGETYTATVFAISAYGVLSSTSSTQCNTTVPTTTTTTTEAVTTVVETTTSTYSPTTSSLVMQPTTEQTRIGSTVTATDPNRASTISMNSETSTPPSPPPTQEVKQTTNNEGSKTDGTGNSAPLSSSSTGLIVVLIFLALLIALFLGMFFLNCYHFGIKTTEIIIGENEVTLTRKFFFIWIPNYKKGTIDCEKRDSEASSATLQTSHSDPPMEEKQHIKIGSTVGSSQL